MCRGGALRPAKIPKTQNKEPRKPRRSFPCEKAGYFLSPSILSSLVMRSQDWLPTVQLVLQADWQVLLHSPQPVIFFA